jgi:hypothetical protein
MTMLIIDEKLLKIVLGGIWKNKPVRSHRSRRPLLRKLELFQLQRLIVKGHLKP